MSLGFADMPTPRPFVLRAAHLDAKRFAPGETFSLDVNVFDLRGSMPEILAEAFSEWVRTGLGPRRGRLELLGSENEAVAVELGSGPNISKCALVLRTPTELKGNPARDQMPFGVLFTRLRERVEALCRLYGDGPLPINLRAGLRERARLVRTVRCELQYREVWRRSSRTGAEHGIGGVTGQVDYEGDLTEFLPWLRAAWWTGVGRHTVWGNGVIEVARAE